MTVVALLLIIGTILAFLGAFGVAAPRVDLFRLGVAIAMLAYLIGAGVFA